MVVDDHRTEEQKQNTFIFVNATDSFMSGWGKASGGNSYFCIACDDLEQARKAQAFLDARSDMKYVATSTKPRKASGSHTSIRHFSETAARYEE